MACPSSMASERKPPELTPSTTFDNISIAIHRLNCSLVSCPFWRRVFWRRLPLLTVVSP